MIEFFNRMKKQELARWGEDTAIEFLKKRNVKILVRNFRTQSGEIDIIGMEDNDLVFFEVKTRSTTQFGYPEDAVDTRKIEKIEIVANEYLDQNNLENQNWRIDTIAIIRNSKNGQHNLKWFKNVD